MAEEGSSGGGDGDSTKKEEKKHTKQTRILIFVGIAGLLLTYLLLRRSQSSSQSGNASVDPNQALAQYEAQNQANLAGLASELQALQSGAGGGFGTGTTSNPPPSITVNVSGAGGTSTGQGGGTPAPRFSTATGNADAAGNILDILGIAQPNGSYTGYNVGGGAPVYALVGGQWKINTQPSQWGPNTELATPQQYAYEISQGTTTEHLG